LPGYGFSKVSPKIRENISRITNTFLEKCSGRLIIVFLLDVRVDPGREDMQMKEWAQYNEVPLIYTFTKTDKLSSNKVLQRKKVILTKLGISDKEVVLYSSRTGKGRSELLSKINLAVSEFKSLHNSKT